MLPTTTSRWCILRTSGPRTLNLAASLNDADMEAWTPSVMAKRRIPRKKSFIEKPAPLLPTFVFARAGHAAELLRLTRLPAHEHPAFSLFRFGGEIVFVRDAEVEQMRLLELRMTPKRRRPTMEIGTEVCPTEGAYAGLTGVVKESDGKLTLVGFGGWMNVKIETSTLINLAVDDAPRSWSAAA